MTFTRTNNEDLATSTWLLIDSDEANELAGAVAAKYGEPGATCPASVAGGYCRQYIFVEDTGHVVTFYDRHGEWRIGGRNVEAALRFMAELS